MEFLEGHYDNELKPISDRLNAIERAHGLKRNEYWPIGKAPPEHQVENKKYDSILDQKQNDTFRKYAPSLFNLLQKDAAEFWKLYEMGRRSVHERSDHRASIVELIGLYEIEAKKSADAGAYYAANSMIGSAVESRLILECLRHPKMTQNIIASLPKRQRPSSKSPLDWRLNTLIEIAAHAGWLPNIDDGDLILPVPSLAHRLRSMRNFLHPGRHAMDKPHARLGKEEWQYAWSGYIALRYAIEQSRKRRPKSNSRRKLLLPR
jgi:hypothetical protein